MEWLPIGFVLGLATAWFFRRRPALRPQLLEQPKVTVPPPQAPWVFPTPPTPPAPRTPHGRWRHPHA